MRYQCRECSYRGERAGQAGSCPACGSFNMAREGSGDEDQAAPKRTWQLRLLIGLWGLLAVLILHKLLS